MRVNPYIFFNGNCEEAMNFYSVIFDAPVTDISRFEDAPIGTEEEKKLIMHARIQMGIDNVIMVCDTPSGNTDIGTNVQLAVEFSDINELNSKFENLAIGGKITMPLQDTFWGARFGMCRDKYNICWMFNCQLNK